MGYATGDVRLIHLVRNY